MENYILVGKILKPQGVKGEVKIEPYTDDPTRFKTLKFVFIDGKKYDVLSAKTGEFCILSLSGITDRNIAETFRNKEIFIDRKDAVKLKENAYFIDDINGAYLTTDKGNVNGKIIEVVKAKTDYFTVQEKDGKIFRFPFLKRLIISVDAQNKKIILNEEKLAEVIVYED